VQLRAEASFAQLLSDLAHELTHAGAKPSWDPYDPGFGPTDYVRAAIEGPGGELDAILAECRVLKELSLRRFSPSTEQPAEGTSPKGLDALYASQCAPHLGPDGEPSRPSLRKAFYRVGKHYGELLEYFTEGRGTNRGGMPSSGPLSPLSPLSLLSLLSLLSNEAPVFLSSTGLAPYPVALLREYGALNRVACENSRRRLEREPAAASGVPSQLRGEARERTERLLRERCARSSVRRARRLESPEGTATRADEDFAYELAD
jgi:hypothetical protein